MRVTVERSELVKSLTHVHRVVERRNTIPILSNILIDGADGRLKLKATDLDIEIVETLSADVAGDGATTVPAHVFYDLVRKLPDGAQIVLESGADDSSLIVRSGRARFMLQVLPAADFPDLTAGEMTHAFTISSAVLKRLLVKTQFAISQEETRYYL
ncbi:MAG: DNA polymerase III subunit beta, partial [Flavobacteriaceae bacterium]